MVVTPAVVMPLLDVVATPDVTLPQLVAMPNRTADVKNLVDVKNPAARAAAVVDSWTSSMAFIAKLNAIVVAARRRAVVAIPVATRTVAMLHQLVVVMLPNPVVAIVAARRAVAARAVAARAVATTNATAVVATKADVTLLPHVAQSPPVDVALLVRPMPSRCLPRRSPMLPR